MNLTIQGKKEESERGWQHPWGHTLVAAKPDIFKLDQPNGKVGKFSQQPSYNLVLSNSWIWGPYTLIFLWLLIVSWDFFAIYLNSFQSVSQSSGTEKPIKTGYGKAASFSLPQCHAVGGTCSQCFTFHDLHIAYFHSGSRAHCSISACSVLLLSLFHLLNWTVLWFQCWRSELRTLDKCSTTDYTHLSHTLENNIMTLFIERTCASLCPCMCGYLVSSKSSTS